jgi:hypothetical protein
VLIAVQNLSSAVSSVDAYEMSLLADYQLRHHVAPAWGLLPPVVSYVNSVHPAAPGTAVISIFDDADQAGDLGWHSEGSGGVIYGRVFAQPVLANGGNAMSDPLSVCSVLSHEAIETFLDSACDLWADGGSGTAYAREGCDAVEGDSYVITIGTGPLAVSGTVSDFLLPGWFDPDADAPYDYLGLTTGPLQVRTTGYTLTMTAGAVSQSFGEHYPSWRRATKTYPLARTARRLHQGTVSGFPALMQDPEVSP